MKNLLKKTKTWFADNQDVLLYQTSYILIGACVGVIVHNWKAPATYAKGYQAGMEDSNVTDVVLRGPKEIAPYLGQIRVEVASSNNKFVNIGEWDTPT
jgi:hypothetical protein